MRAKIKKREKEEELKVKVSKTDSEIVRKFAKKVYKELGPFIVSLVVFGSSVRTKEKELAKDIDILIIVDDVHTQLNREIIETYRIIIAKAVQDTIPKNPQRLHVQTMQWSSFWEYLRAGDPIAINILRDGLALIDIGFFDPMQILLRRGRIRPTAEAIWTYYSLAPASIKKAKTHVLMAIVDLYWAAIDAAHAALMVVGEIPPSPKHVAEMINEKLVKPGYIEAKYDDIMQDLYEVSKKILHREVEEYSGDTYERYEKMAEEFVERMRKFINERKELSKKH